MDINDLEVGMYLWDQDEELLAHQKLDKITKIGMPFNTVGLKGRWGIATVGWSIWNRHRLATPMEVILYA